MIPENIASLRARIAEAAGRARRTPGEITLVAVSKTHGPEAVMEAAAAGLTVFGENRVQEARAKAPLVSAPVSWHLIGHLQSNKVRQALGLFQRIHSIDKLDLARDVNRVAGELGLKPKVFLEVNVGGEESKFGFDPEALRGAMPELLGLEHLSIEGLMAIPPLVSEPGEARPYFVALRELRDRLSTECGVKLPELSMGMSGDFEVAIEEGATFVRVGTALFGERQGKAWKP
jgi:PLP dependent protein